MYSYWKRQVLMLDQAQLTKNWPEKLESKINIRYAEKPLHEGQSYADNEKLMNQKTVLKARTQK